MKNLAVIAVIALLLLRPKKANKGSVFVPGQSKLKGIRNNNPGNIRLTNIEWKGKVPNVLNTDGEFEQFYTMFDGVRATLKNLLTHYTRGKNTVRKLVTTWAPYSDNPVDAVNAYIDAVSVYAGLPPDKVFEWNEKNAINIAYSIFRFENAGETISKNIIKSAYNAI